MLTHVPPIDKTISDSVLTPDALQFLLQLHTKFNDKRLDLLEVRKLRQEETNEGKMPHFINSNDSTWCIAPIPEDLQKRNVEITGPTDAKMIINALNSGADVFMADFEDSNVPSWKNLIEGQANLTKAIDRTLTFTNPEGKVYKLNDKTAVLMVRPRGWHLNEKHVVIEGTEMSGSLFDFGLYFFHNAKKLLSKGSGPYFYLPKMESHFEARLWNEVFDFSENYLKIPGSTIKATVLIETLFAAFEMDAILYELKDHSAGLNAGRWDYLFSTIRTFQKDPKFIFPDRGQITMTAPFMKAYTELLIKTCHKRGAHAMGGMSAFIPSRKDKAVNDIALEKVREDKRRESKAGCDGTWVAHPDLVSVAREIFSAYLGTKPNQLEVTKDDVKVSESELLDFTISGGKITEAGFHQNISIALIYLESWLRGNGAVAIANLMEDAATAEISRAQLWQWLHNPAAKFDNGKPITAELYKKVLADELEQLKGKLGSESFAKGKFVQASEILNELILNPKFEPFLTPLAYSKLEN